MLSKNVLAIKKKIAVKEMFTLKKELFGYNLIILKEVVIIAGISNHTIVDFIEKKLVMMFKKTLLVFFLPIILQDL